MKKLTAQIRKIDIIKIVGVLLGSFLIFSIYLQFGQNLPLNKTKEKTQNKEEERVLKFNEENNKYEVEGKSFGATLPSSEDKGIEIKNPNKESLKLNLVDAKIGEAEADENSILYKEAYEKTDVKYETLKSGIKESIILKETGHPESFAFDMDLSGYDYIVEPTGRIKVYRTGHKGEDLFLVFDIPAPYMEDAEQEKSHDIKVEVNDNRIEVTPNNEWLKTATYPVIIQ